MPATPLIAEVTAIARVLADAGGLRDWHIDAVLDCTLDSPAQIQVDAPFQRARISIRPDWPTRDICTLRELIAHEIGHIWTSQPFEAGRSPLIGAASSATKNLDKCAFWG